MSSSTCQIIQQPLESVEFIAILSSFCDLLQSSLGPRGGLKMLTTGGGYSILTSSSSRILNNTVLDHPVCLFISQIIKAQLADFKDGGLYTGILTSSILRHTLAQETVPVHSASSIVQQISSYMVEQFHAIKITVDFSTVEHLMPLVKSILRSKPLCRLSRSEEQRLTVNIVKAFLYSVDDTVGDIIVLSEEGSEFHESESLYPGVLYQTSTCESTETMLYKVFNKCDTVKNGFKIVLFNVMLSDEKANNRRDEAQLGLEVDKEKRFDVNTTLEILKLALQLGVMIVACQKVVHPDLCLYLRRNRILLLDRMGTELTRHVEKLSGAKPISNVERCVNKEFLVPYLGHVSAVRNVQRGKKRYVALERDGRNVSTLVIGGINSEVAAELKISTQQGLQALRHLLMEPYVLPGAGCAEMALIAGFETKARKAFDEGKLSYPLSHIHACVRLLQLSILSAGGFRSNSLSSYATDTAHYHAWESTELTDWSACRCGLVTTGMVRGDNKDWIYLDLNAPTLLEGCEIPKSSAVLSLNDNSVLDLFASKFNAMKLSMECYSGLMNIGMIVYRPAR